MNISIERIIATFYLPHDESIDEARKTKEDVSLESDANLFAKSTLENLVESNRLVPYICALLAASTDDDDNASRRRHLCFIISVEYLKLGAFNDQHRKECADRLFMNLKLLSERQAEKAVHKIVDDFCPKNELSFRGHSTLLELISPLVSRSKASTRDSIIGKLCELSWPSIAVAMLSSTLIDICETEEQSYLALTKVSRYIRWNINSFVPKVAGSTTNYENRDGNVEPEELPALFYQITSLVRKCEAATSALKNVVVGVVASALDRLILSMHFSNPLEVNFDTSGGPCDEAMTCEKSIKSIYDSDGSSRRRIDAIISTIVHHLSLVVSKDQGIAAEITNCIKTRQLLVTDVGSIESYIFASTQRHQAIAGRATFASAAASSSSRPRAGLLVSSKQPASDTRPSRVSPARLLLSCLAARAPRQQDKVISGMVEAISEAQAVQEKISSSLWFQEQTWKSALQLRVDGFFKSFSLLLRGPMMLEQVVAPLVIMAFSLIDSPRQVHRSAWDTVLPATVQCLPRPALKQPGAQALGAWLLVRLFCLCEQSRGEIAKGIVLRLVMSGIAAAEVGPVFGGGGGGGAAGGSSSSSILAGSSLPGQTSAQATHAQTARIGIAVLRQLAISCSYGLSDVSGDLQEAFASLPDLDHHTSGGLITAVSPLFSTSTSLADRCALALRKSSFSKDCNCRQAAVSALLALLKAQLILSGRGSGSGSGSGSSRRTIGLSVDEILALLRRFLQHQVAVRIVLYNNVFDLQALFPSFRPSAIRLLSDHLASMLKGNDRNLSSNSSTGGRSMGPPLTAASNGLGLDLSATWVDLDACLDISHRPQERISSLLITMLGLATMKSPPGSDEAEDREGDRDLSAFFPGFSQIASSSSSSHSLQSSQSSQSQFMAMNDSSSSSAAQRLSLSPESAMACKTLWGVVNTTVELHTTDFGVYSAELSDTDPYNAVEAGKAELLMQLCHACLVTATRLPEKFGSVRVSAAQRIIAIVKLRDRLQTAATVSVFQAKLRLRDAKKDKGKKKVRTAELGEGEDADEDDGLGKERETDVAAPGLGGSVSADTGGAEVGLHHVRMDLECAMTILDLCNAHVADADDDDDLDNGNDSARVQSADRYILQSTNSLMQGQPDEGSKLHGFLHTYALDLAVRSLDTVLALLCHLDDEDSENIFCDEEEEESAEGLSASSFSSTSAAGGLSMREARQQQQYGPDDSAQPAVHKIAVDKEMRLHQLAEMRIMCDDMMALLFRALMRLRLNASTDGAYGGGGGGRKRGAGGLAAVGDGIFKFSPMQLVFRGMLACIRIHIAASSNKTMISAVTRQLLSTGSAVASTTSAATTTTSVPQPSRGHRRVAEGSLGESGGPMAVNCDPVGAARVGKRGGGQSSARAGEADTQLSGNQQLLGMIERGLGAVDTSTSVTSTKSTTAQVTKQLKSHIDNFFSMMTSILSDDVDTNQSHAAVGPVVVAIMGELVSVLPPQERTNVATRLLEECSGHVKSPSQQLSQSLVQFFVLLCASNPADRLLRAVTISELIAECSAVTEAGHSYEMDEETYSVVWSKTLTPTTLCLVGILEKALVEATMLQKLKEKLRTTSKRIQRVKTATAGGDGHIFSDDDDNDEESGSSAASLMAAASKVDMESITLKRLAEVAVNLIWLRSGRGANAGGEENEEEEEDREHIAIAIPGTAERIVGFFTRLLKLQVKIVRALTAQGVRHLPTMFKTLAEFTAESRSKLDDYISTVQNSDETRLTRQAKLVPELIFQMEQLDTQMMKLSRTVIDKTSFRSLIRRSTARDFKVQVQGGGGKGGTKRKKKKASRDDDNDEDGGVGDGGGQEMEGGESGLGGRGRGKRRDEQKEEEEEHDDDHRQQNARTTNKRGRSNSARQHRDSGGEEEDWY